MMGGQAKIEGQIMATRNPTDPVANQINQAVQQLVNQTFGKYSRNEAWTPAMNIYQLPGRLEVCVDLAGIDRRQVDIQVHPGTLRIRGSRLAPDPPGHGEGPMRILSMEIDYGPFCRVLEIPKEVDLQRVESRYRDGMLWITLPFRRS